MLEMLFSLIPERTLITRDHYNKWKRDPVTVRLHNDLILALLEQIQDDLPESVDSSIPLAYQREGARKMIDILLYWQPVEVRNEELSNED